MTAFCHLWWLAKFSCFQWEALNNIDFTRFIFFKFDALEVNKVSREHQVNQRDQHQNSRGDRQNKQKDTIIILAWLAGASTAACACWLRLQIIAVAFKVSFEERARLLAQDGSSHQNNETMVTLRFQHLYIMQIQ